MTGTAGWSIPRAHAQIFPGDGTHLQRYAQVFRCAEINSSFYRAHAFELYARWASFTPANFRFSVKVPKQITHEARLRRARGPLQQFLSEVTGLGVKLGPLLVQLPPSMEFNLRVARNFFALLRDMHGHPVVCEPRHKSWLTDAAEKIFIQYAIGRVFADPPIPSPKDAPRFDMTGPHSRVVYYRLHGAPQMYWSIYSPEEISVWAKKIIMSAQNHDVWCIFDNTASGGAITNALDLTAFIASQK